MLELIYVITSLYGLADNFKGIITCNEIAKIKNIKFTINTTLVNNIGFKKYVKCEFLDDNIINGKIYKFVQNMSRSSFIRFIKQLNIESDKKIYIMTNLDPFFIFYNVFDKKIKSFNEIDIKWNINDFINFTYIKFNAEINEYNYDVLHIRFGDKYLYYSGNNIDIKYDRIIMILNDINIVKSKNLILLGDNKHLVDIVKKQIIDKIKYNIFYINTETKTKTKTKSIHLNDANKEQDLIDIFDDFIMIMNANNVFNYNWSGYSFYGSLFGQKKYYLI